MIAFSPPGSPVLLPVLAHWAGCRTSSGRWYSHQWPSSEDARTENDIK